MWELTRIRVLHMVDGHADTPDEARAQNAIGETVPSLWWASVPPRTIGRRLG
jgi:hypothetical protein